VSQRRSSKTARRRKRQQQRPDAPHLRLVDDRRGWRPPPPTRTLPAELDGPGSLPEAVRLAAAEPDPLFLLGLASTVLASFDPRLQEPFDDDLDDLDDLDDGELLPDVDLVLALLAADAWETHLLCRVMAAVTRYPQITDLVRASQPDRIPAPAWVDRLDDLGVGAALLSTEPLGLSENVVLELQLPGGGAACLVAMVDHTLHGAVTDAYVAPIAARDYVRVAEESEGDLLSTRPIEPGEARVRLDRAVAAFLENGLDEESDSWPGTLPLLERVLRELPFDPEAAEGPAGLSLDERDERREALVEEFLGSELFPFDRLGHEADTAHLLAVIHDLHLRTGLLQVTPDAVRRVMLDLWADLSLGLSDTTRAALPEVLRGWARFVHRRSGVDPAMTEDVLAAVDLLEPQFRALLADEEGPMGTAELFHHLLGAGLEDGYPDPEDVDPDPLPDEPLVLPELPPAELALLEEVLALAEPVTLRLFGVEARTALRRTAARLAEDEPRVFTRGRSPARTAAALTWVVAVVNDLVGRYGVCSAAELLAAFGVKGSVADRGTAMLQELGWDDADDASARLLHLDLTVSSKRQEYLGE
jgi:hypothetical protein